MSAEQNKAISRRYLDAAWNRHDYTIIDELIAPDYRQHNRTVQTGRDGVKAFFRMMSSAFPDARYTVEQMVAEDDQVAWCWTIQATHTGPFQGIPATGKTITITGMNLMRLADGILVENWGEQDTLGLLQQLGAVPAPRA